MALRIIGIDIGGTKCAVSILSDGVVKEVGRFPTQDFATTFQWFRQQVAQLAPGPEVVLGYPAGAHWMPSEGLFYAHPIYLAGWIWIFVVPLPISSAVALS